MKPLELHSSTPDGTSGTGSSHANAMPVGPDTVVGFHYDLYDDQSNQVETSMNGAPVLFLFGESQVLAALQDAFLGRRAGDDFSVSIPHTQAYGRYYPDRKQRVARKRIDGGKQQSFRPGQIIHIRSQNGGAQPATVVKVGKFNVDVDSNHPLAGKDLTFDVKIVSVRESTAEERAHGHAHGVGGHQH